MKKVHSPVRTSVKWFLWVASASVIAATGGTIMWLILLGQAPPSLVLTPSEPIATVSKTEAAALGTFAGIGPNRAGSCIRVLSLDGGGVRGLVPALILAEIERQTGRPIYKQFDLIVGTSTGSIIALGLTRPSNADAQQPLFAAKDLVEFYRDQASEIFPRSFLLLRNFRRLFRPKFGPDAVESLYEKYFEDVRLHEALTNVAVPAYDIEENRRIWFRSNVSAHGELLMRHIVRGATAAPTYFPPARFQVPLGVSSTGHVALVDGALFANNPAIDALAMAQKLMGNQEDKSLLLLSIGTGQSVLKRSFDDAWGWGMLGWIDPLLEIAFSGSAIDEQAKQELVWNKYFRIQVSPGQPPIALDDSSPDAIRKLEAITGAFIQEEAAKISDVVAELTLPRSTQCGVASGNDYEPVIGPRVRDDSGLPQ